MKVVLTIMACFVSFVAGIGGFIYSGIYDVSALEPDNAVIRWVLHTTSDHSVDARLGGIVVPPGLDQPQVIRSGGHLYAQSCVVCHGGPGIKPTDIAQGLNPQPANLFRSTRKPWMEEMFWFIKHGVKMTAMPGFGKTHMDEQIWELATFLRKAPSMSPEDFAALTDINAPTTEGAKPVGG